jgi:hypothetical protein
MAALNYSSSDASVWGLTGFAGLSSIGNPIPRMSFFNIICMDIGYKFDLSRFVAS